MKLKPLHDRFLEKMKEELPDWRFVSTFRHFKKKHSFGNLLLHVAFINHFDDFDVTIDVAAEFVSGRERFCIVGAELGNIEGIGQFRVSVHSVQSAEDSAVQAVARLRKVGFPFLEHFSNVRNVLATLKAGGPQAMLISPLLDQHAEQITRLESLANAC
jgi:hypothetical protein